MKRQFTFKKVVRFQDLTTKYNRTGEGSREHFLECGHRVVTKRSYGFHPQTRRQAGTVVPGGGARNVQLQFFAAIKFIDEPTDAAWDKNVRN